MTEQLPPDVRDRAAEVADSVIDGWRPDLEKDFALARMEYALVDAVTAVVAPEIARPLQARIEELEATLSDNRKMWDRSIAQTGSALEHVEHVERERDSLARRCAVRFEATEKLQARVELLTAALDTAIEALGWASDYVAVPWPKAYQVEPLEFDSPAPDYTMRQILRNRLRDALNGEAT